MSMKNPLTPVGIEPATFRFVAQHLNHCATSVPRLLMHITEKLKDNEISFNFRYIYVTFMIHAILFMIHTV